MHCREGYDARRLSEVVEETMMSPLQTLDHELKKLGPKSKTENPVFLKLIQWIPPHPIDNEKEHTLFLEVLKKISLFLKEADADRPVNEIWRQYGISSATYYKWKATYGGAGGVRCEAAEGSGA